MIGFDQLAQKYRWIDVIFQWADNIFIVSVRTTVIFLRLEMLISIVFMFLAMTILFAIVRSSFTYSIFNLLRRDVDASYKSGIICVNE